jgi:Rab-GTPase-TBC domain
VPEVTSAYWSVPSTPCEWYYWARQIQHWAHGPIKAAERYSSPACDSRGARVQVSVDVPRTAPEVPVFQTAAMQRALRRLLYIWGVRHPASGYVQGVNDLVTPFLAVFLSEHLAGPMAGWDVAALSDAQLIAAEADSYWCLCKLVERRATAMLLPSRRNAMSCLLLLC